LSPFELGHEILVLNVVGFVLVEAFTVVVACLSAVLTEFLVVIDFDLEILRTDLAST